MIRHSPFVKALCIAAASALVVGATTLSRAPEPIQMEGAGESAQARMGSRFEDMAVGTLTAQPVRNLTPAAPPPTSTPTAAKPVVTAALPVQTVSPPVTAKPPLAQAVAPTVLPAKPPVQTITATQEAAASPQTSSRPKQRDPVLAAKAAPPKPVAKAKAPRKDTAKPRGNATRANTKGTNNAGKKTAAKTQGKPKRTAKASGNAAAKNYPGQVMRRIARVAKPRVNNRGTAVVAFSVSASGRLSRVSIARSSGSSKLDQAALRVIKKAAPFPAPPRGAQRNFSIRIKGR